MPYALTMVAVLSIREPLQSVVEMRRDTAEATQHAMAEMLKRRRAWCSVGEARRLGDLCVLLNIIGTADNEKEVSWEKIVEHKVFITGRVLREYFCINLTKLLKMILS